MRFHVSALLFLALFLTSCAQQGVIVRKDSNPLPFYLSVGVEGSYTFHLRDASGAVHRQVVTPEVFDRYAVGQYFNDLQPGATDPKAVAMARPAQTATRVATARKVQSKRQVASKTPATKKKVAKRSGKKSIAQRTAKKSPAKRAVAAPAKPKAVPTPLLSAAAAHTEHEVVYLVARVR